MALVEGVDRAIFLGDAGANEDTADFTGLPPNQGSVLRRSLEYLENGLSEGFVVTGLR